MLVVGGVTYRIERTAPHCYEVVRLLDDSKVGAFRTMPRLRLEPQGIELSQLRDIVRAALRSARTSQVMHVAPVLEPGNDVMQAGAPSTVPPASPVAI
jgi:hypothetical protein